MYLYHNLTHIYLQLVYCPPIMPDHFGDRLWALSAYSSTEYCSPPITRDHLFLPLIFTKNHSHITSPSAHLGTYMQCNINALNITICHSEPLTAKLKLTLTHIIATISDSHRHFMCLPHPRVLQPHHPAFHCHWFPYSLVLMPSHCNSVFTHCSQSVNNIYILPHISYH